MISHTPSLSVSAARPRLPLFLLVAASAWMALALVCGLSSVNPALGQSLKTELSNGNVGERYDGYLQARNNSAQSLVNSINAQRKKLYEKRAKELGQPVSVVGKVYAKELYDRAAGGTWFLLEGDVWSQKP